jgi:hypothetical protein
VSPSNPPPAGAPYAGPAFAPYAPPLPKLALLGAGLGSSTVSPTASFLICASIRLLSAAYGTGSIFAMLTFTRVSSLYVSYAL